MILCVNLNAAVDKTVIVAGFELGQIHRPEAIKALPGGKGCNVARALKRFGEEATVTGWVGGSAGEFIERGLRQEGIHTDFVYTDFESRTCLSILDSRDQTLTEVYEKGQQVPPQKIEEMIARYRGIIGSYAAVTLSGSLPPGVPADFYGTLVEIARGAGVPAFLDSSKKPLLQGAAARPFLIKPNRAEVAVLSERELVSMADYVGAAAAISGRYQAIVVLSLGEDGAIASRGGEIIHAQNPKVKTQSAVGSGDCLLAGLAHGFARGLSLAEAVKVGVAAGTANALVVGAGQFSMRDFADIHARTTITPKGYKRHA